LTCKAALAALHVNQNGGVLNKNYNLIFNSASSAEESVEKALTLLDDYEVQALITTTSSRTLAILEETRPRSVLQISETATSPELTTANDSDLLFRTAPSDVHQGKVMAKLAAENNAQTAVFVYCQGDSYGAGLFSEFMKEFILLGGENVDYVEVPENLTVGFDQLMPQVYDSQPDVVVLALLGPTLIL